MEQVKKDVQRNAMEVVVAVKLRGAVYRVIMPATLEGEPIAPAPVWIYADAILKLRPSLYHGQFLENKTGEDAVELAKAAATEPITLENLLEKIREYAFATA